MDLYSEIILDHYRKPRNLGTLRKFTHQASEVNPFCGDGISIQLQITNYKLQILKYKAEGCAVSIASASILSEYLLGKKVDEIINMNEQDLLKLLGISLSMTRVKCAMLPLLAIKKSFNESK